MLDRYIKTKTFSYIYTILLMALACAIVVLGWGDYIKHPENGQFVIVISDVVYQGVIALVMIVAVMLVVSSRLTDAMLPAMLLAVLVTVCYDSADKFLSSDFIWVAVPAVAAVIFHFVLYRKPLRIGRSFWGLCAVTVAVTLGGVGTITQAEYFSGTALFYVFGLGVGMMLFYLLVKSQSIGDSKEGVARAVYAAGMLAAFCIIWIYYRNWGLFLEQGEFLAPQLGNNISTFLMLAMPFPLFYASRRYVDVFAMAIMYVAAVFSGSRAGLVMGTAEFLFLLVIYSIVYQKGIGGWVRRIFYLGVTIGFVAAVVYFLPQLARLSGMEVADGMTRTEVVKYLYENFVHSGEARVDLLGRVKTDFLKNPVFGVGIGYTGNSDIYNPVKGAMNWYHMWFAQVIGGLGVVGVLAYGYQLVDRVITFFKNRCYIHFTFLMSYMGLFLMSQVNPGEFCPVPYAMLAVTYFLMMEDPARDIVVGKGRTATDEKAKDKTNIEEQAPCMRFDKGESDMLSRELLGDFMDKVCVVYTSSDFAYYGRITDANDGWIRIEGERSVRLVNADMIKEISLSADQSMPPEDSIKRTWRMMRFSMSQRKQRRREAKDEKKAQKSSDK